MPKKTTNAEHMRIYRLKIKDDPSKKAAYADKERERWHSRIAEGKVKVVAQMGQREKRCKRKNGKLQRLTAD